MSLVLRETKGSELTISEMDGNLTYLETLTETAITGPTGSTGPTGADSTVTGPIGPTEDQLNLSNSLHS